MHNLLKRLRFLGVSLFALPLTLAAWADNPVVPAGGAPAPGATAAAQQPSMWGSMFPLILMFGVVYLLILRPQQKKMREQQQMLGALKHGDEVLTASGILGTITGITDRVVTVEVADNVRVKMLKSQVSQVIKGNIKDLPA
jgi:preprotein translocase subunit YajC